MRSTFKGDSLRVTRLRKRLDKGSTCFVWYLSIDGKSKKYLLLKKCFWQIIVRRDNNMPCRPYLGWLLACFKMKRREVEL